MKYSLGDVHPMNSRRLDIPYQLFRSLNFLDDQIVKFFTPEPASENDLIRFHTEKYIKMVKALSKAGDGYYGRYGLGTGDCPVFPEMHEVSQLIVGGALEGVKRIMAGEVDQVFSLMAGLHHAFAERAAGFCYYNDAVIAIKLLQEEYGLERILYIDTDVHHGDGVLGAFYDSKKVLGISIHESPQFLFPGTGLSDEIGEGEGVGYSINMPLFPGTWDEQYKEMFEQIIPCIWESYNPEFVIWQCGADGHFGDVLGHLNKNIADTKYVTFNSTAISISSSTTEYTMPSDVSEAARDNQLRVWLAQTSTSSDERWVEVHGWRVSSSASAGTGHELILPYQYTAGLAVGLEYTKKHPKLWANSSKLHESVPWESVVYPTVRDLVWWRKSQCDWNDYIEETTVAMEESGEFITDYRVNWEKYNADQKRYEAQIAHYENLIKEKGYDKEFKLPEVDRDKRVSLVKKRRKLDIPIGTRKA